MGEVERIQEAFKNGLINSFEKSQQPFEHIVVALGALSASSIELFWQMKTEEIDLDAIEPDVKKIEQKILDVVNNSGSLMMSSTALLNVAFRAILISILTARIEDNQEADASA